MKPTLTIKNLGGTTGNIVVIPNDVGIQLSTFLSRDTTAATFTYVENANYFTASQKALLGSVGASNAEFLTVSSITLTTNASPSAINFGSGPVNRHARGELVSQITFDQIEISYSTTLTGSYSLVTTTLGSGLIGMQVNTMESIFLHSAGASTGYYKIRLKNSVTGLFSDYSDPISSSAVVSGTAGYLINSLKKTLGIDGTDSAITDDFLLESLNEARRILDREYMTGLMKEWRQVFEYPIKLLAGCNYVTLPTNIDYSQTNRSVLAARYSSNSAGASMPLQYVDKKDWNTATLQRRYTQITNTASIGATSLVLDNTGDFPSAGSVQFQAEDYSQTILTVSFTANNKDTNTLSGVTGVTRQITAGSQGWAYQTQAYPTLYTVIDGKLYFDSVIPQALNGINLFIDYYKALADITNFSEAIPEHYSDIYKNYLRFAIKRRRDNTLGKDDPDFVRFLDAAKSTLGTDYIGQTIRIK